jgi:hypothetical protein
MFIEVTRYMDDKKQIINVNQIIRVVPNDTKDGYGRPQTGCEVHLPDDDITRVIETYDKVKELIREVGVRIND